MTACSARGCDQHPLRDGAGTSGGLGMSWKTGAWCRGGGGGGESGGVGGSSSSDRLLLGTIRPRGRGGGIRTAGGAGGGGAGGAGGGRLDGGSQIFCRDEWRSAQWKQRQARPWLHGFAAVTQSSPWWVAAYSWVYPEPPSYGQHGACRAGGDLCRTNESKSQRVQRSLPYTLSNGHKTRSAMSAITFV